jgi:iron complex outermembrane recepter protein
MSFLNRPAVPMRLIGATLLAGTVASTVGGLAAGAARAQDPAAPGAGHAVTLDTLSVEGRGDRGDGPVRGYVARQSRAGTKTDTPLAETPQSITVVGRQQMDDQRVRSVAEALNYAPGVFTAYRGASNVRDELFVRGFYYAPRYLDGMLLGGDEDYAKINPYLLERVELISGPSSLLYGQTSPGGLVNMVSKKPLLTAPLRETRLTLGSRSYLEGAFDVSDRIAGTDALAFRIVGTGLSTDLQERFAKQRGVAIAPSLSWAPSADTTLTLLSGYQWEPNFGYRNFLDADGTVRPIARYGYLPRDFFVSDPNFERAERSQAWIGYEAEHQASDAVTLRQKLRYYWVDHFHHTLTWGRTSPDPVTGAKTIVSRTASGGTDAWGTLTNDNQVELKLATGPVAHTLLAGVDYRDRDRKKQWGFNPRDVPAISLTAPIYGYDFSRLVLDPDQDTRASASQVGLYLQDQAKVGDLNLMAGLREDWARTTITERVTPGVQRKDDSALTYRVGALYTLPAGIAPYVSYATSFEPTLESPPPGKGPFKPVTADQIEGGVKFAPDGTHMLFTAAYYDIWQQNVVQKIYTPFYGFRVAQQIGAIHNRGVELAAEAEVTSNLSLIAAYSHIASTIVRTGFADERGKTPSRVPGDMASLWVKYAFDSGILRGLTLGAGVRYLGTSWGDNTNTFRVPAYTLVDALLAYDLGALDRRYDGASLQLNARNIGDVTYAASCANKYACFYGEGVTVTGALNVRW